MKRIFKIAGIATLVAVLAAVAVGATVFADENEDGFPFDFGERFKSALADILGITVDEYDAAVEQANGQVLDEAVEEGWLTEDQAEKMGERMAEGPGMRGGRGGLMGPDGRFGRRDGSLLDIAAEQLGMSVEDLRAEIQDGKSIADVAEETGKDVQDIADAYLAKLEETLNQAVKDGKLTQERADYMLEQAGLRITDQLNNTWEGPMPGQRPEGFPGGQRPGRKGEPTQDTGSNL